MSSAQTGRPTSVATARGAARTVNKLSASAAVAETSATERPDGGAST